MPCTLPDKALYITERLLNRLIMENPRRMGDTVVGTEYIMLSTLYLNGFHGTHQRTYVLNYIFYNDLEPMAKS